MRTLAAALALAALVTACGGSDGSTSSTADREVRVTMVDNAYRPTTLRVGRGETVTFTFVNDGKVEHEAVIGDADEQASHEKEMGDMGGMGGSDRADAVVVKPGGTGTLTHTFDARGAVLIGCHEPGHYASGMKLAVEVA